MSESTWRHVLADYRYLRATLSAIVQPDRQMSVKELVDSALNYDTMHGDTAMVVLNQLDARAEAAEQSLSTMRALLARIEYVELDSDGLRCPACTMSDMGGHYADCELAAALSTQQAGGVE